MLQIYSWISCPKENACFAAQCQFLRKLLPVPLYTNPHCPDGCIAVLFLTDLQHHFRKHLRIKPPEKHVWSYILCVYAFPHSICFLTPPPPTPPSLPRPCEIVSETPWRQKKKVPFLHLWFGERIMSVIIALQHALRRARKMRTYSNERKASTWFNRPLC